MPKIKCHYDECVFLEAGYCGAAAVELEPEAGCLTFRRDTEAEATEAEEWDEDEFEDELEEEEELYEEEEEEDLWDEEDDDDEERY